MRESCERIGNRDLRRLLLFRNRLYRDRDYSPDSDGATTQSKGGARVDAIVSHLGFVQVDSVAAIERAHHHILYSRIRSYKRNHLRECLEKTRSLFENWTHDAAILPASSFPYWRHYFRRFEDYEVHPGYRRYFAPATKGDLERVLRHVEEKGASRPRDFGNEKKVDWQDPYFAKPTVAKLALERLWRVGKLAVTRRDGQEKVYDLAERVVPKEAYRARVSAAEFRDWACTEALRGLGVASPTSMARFSHAVSKEVASKWCEQNLGKKTYRVQGGLADGTWSSGASFADEEAFAVLPRLGSPPQGLRFLNPFDPLIRDRERLLRVFGFDYRLEIWVPKSKRQYGYYVLPILEGERFTGRIDLKVDRNAGQLQVLGLWWERGVSVTQKRQQGLERELDRLSRFAEVDDVLWRDQATAALKPGY